MKDCTNHNYYQWNGIFWGEITWRRLDSFPRYHLVWVSTPVGCWVDFTAAIYLYLTLWLHIKSNESNLFDRFKTCPRKLTQMKNLHVRSFLKCIVISMNIWLQIYRSVNVSFVNQLWLVDSPGLKRNFTFTLSHFRKHGQLTNLIEWPNLIV